MVTDDLQLLAYFLFYTKVIRKNHLEYVFGFIHLFKSKSISGLYSHQFNAGPYCISPLCPVFLAHTITTKQHMINSLFELEEVINCRH